MQNDTPDPDKLADYLLDPTMLQEGGSVEARRESLKAEAAVAAKYWGGIQTRMVLTFLAFGAAWISILVMGMNGTIPLWVGLILNTAMASTFYMPMHEATHKNIWGRVSTARQLEDVIGVLCSVPLLMQFSSHRSAHMRHHAFTNDPERDPDYWSHGSLREFPLKWVSLVVINTFLPVIALVPASRKLIHPMFKRILRGNGNKKEGLVQLRFWLVTHVVLLVLILSGLGVPALMLWYLPARLQTLWLTLVFAWYPHFPSDKVGRYVDTRVAVFPGSTLLIRGHDHHALHHLFPRVPHYRLPAMWREMATDLVPKGVRTEGRALEATGPVLWR